MRVDEGAGRFVGRIGRDHLAMLASAPQSLPAP